MLTTLGVGDLAANSGGYRTLTVVQAAMGFSYFGMTITYFLSVYSSLLNRNAFAEELYHKSSKRNDAAELIAKITQAKSVIFGSWAAINPVATPRSERMRHREPVS